MQTAMTTTPVLTTAAVTELAKPRRTTRRALTTTRVQTTAAITELAKAQQKIAMTIMHVLMILVTPIQANVKIQKERFLLMGLAAR